MPMFKLDWGNIGRKLNGDKGLVSLLKSSGYTEVTCKQTPAPAPLFGFGSVDPLVQSKMPYEVTATKNGVTYTFRTDHVGGEPNMSITIPDKIADDLARTNGAEYNKWKDDIVQVAGYRRRFSKNRKSRMNKKQNKKQKSRRRR